MDLEGLIFVSREFGYCKVTSHVNNRVRVYFVGANREAWYSTQAIASNDFDWCAMPVGLKCRTRDKRLCTILESSFKPSETHRAYEYLVAFEGDAAETARFTERDLLPLPDSLVETPLTRIVGLQADSLAHFRARESFLAALKQVERESANIKALAAARITLHPHQAFVVGTVIDDPTWRYILADEVGLGKTIEAGAIAHQLLSQKPDARVLVLTPGSLARQWLCEMRQSFGGREFRLLDLHDAGVSLATWPLVISSIKDAIRRHATEIDKTIWDLVIVDEAHHVLWNQDQYAFVELLASKCPRLLLLSAVPARERDVELLQLLRLIDPIRYREGGPTARSFSSLYAAQPNIGRRMRIVARQLNQPDEMDLEQVHEDVERLLSLQELSIDQDLRALQQEAQAATRQDAAHIYERLIGDVVSRYRVSRRILKNRRARLVDAELMSNVSRSVEAVFYEPSSLESQIENVAIDFLQRLAEADNFGTLQFLYRMVAQALCDPVALYDIAVGMASAGGDASAKDKHFDLNSVFDYDEHEALIEHCATLFSQSVHLPTLNHWVSLLRSMLEQVERPRTSALKRYIKDSLSVGAKKIVVFSGARGSASFLTEFLVAEYGRPAVASFRHELADDDKEKEATRFRRDPACQILVSDESGGEGRNFQFADELVHFDLPWSVAAMEQRVGRLDRIGRNRPVRSVVICPASGLEREWLRCLETGFGVFSRSISGLEFMLQDAEKLVIRTAIEDGIESIPGLVQEISEAGERERAADDAEALTDATSFQRASGYLSAIDGTSDSSLEAALPSYLQAISRTSSAKRITDSKDDNLKIWLLRPEEVTDYDLMGMTREGLNPLKDCFGTFSRSIARDRPDLDFFSIGHPLVDALAMAARQHVRGRSVLAEVQTDLASPGLYLLAAWRVSNLHSEDGSLQTPQRALRLLGGRAIWTAVPVAGGEALEATLAGRLSRFLGSDSTSVRALSRKEAVELFRPEPGYWSAEVSSALERARVQARLVYSQKYQESDKVYCEQILADAVALIKSRQDEDDVLLQMLGVEAIRAAELEPDVVGLVQISPVASA